MSRVTLTLRGLRFAYGDGSWFLDVPELHLGEERITCVVGPNGSGKSTLLRIAAGILQPFRGEIALGGRPLEDLSRRTIARSVGFLPQEDVPLFDYSVEETVRMGRYAHLRGIGIMTPEDRDAVERALTAVELVALRKRPLSHLSGGERRRALIASVLAQQPDVLLLDEPTSSLDLHHALALMRLLASFGPEGPAVVLVTHDINLAALFGERLLLLIDGRVCADGVPEEVVRPEILAQAYGDDVLVEAHPETGGPMVVPRRTGGGEGRTSHV